MKTSQATINFYLKTAKKLSDGSHPIMLRVCFKGYKDISSHYSCTVRYWDKKNQCVKKGFSNWSVINYELNKLKSSIIAKRDEFIRLGIEYTPSMLLSFDEVKKGISNVVSELIVNYYTEKELRGSTVTAWKHSRTLIEEFHKGCIITEIDEGWCKRYARWLGDRGLSEGTVRTRLGHIAAIFRYACGKGLVDMGRYPYRDWQYTQKFKLAERIQYVDKRCVDIMKDYFLSKVIKMTSERMFTYIDDGYIDYKNRLFVIYFWLLGYYLQGLSPIDICMLKKSDFEVKQIGDEEWYCIDTSRMKTKVNVKIRVRVHTIYSQVMIGRMLMSDGEWFLPIMHGMDGKDEDKCKIRMRSIFSYWLNPKLSDWWKELNQVIIQKNVDEKLNIPLIDESCTFYSYRHSFAQMYINNPQASPIALATLMGRSVNTLSTYIEQLKEENDLIDAVSIIG